MHIDGHVVTINPPYNRGGRRQSERWLAVCPNKDHVRCSIGRAINLGADLGHYGTHIYLGTWLANAYNEDLGCPHNRWKPTPAAIAEYRTGNGM